MQNFAWRIHFLFLGWCTLQELIWSFLRVYPIMDELSVRPVKVKVSGWTEKVVMVTSQYAYLEATLARLRIVSQSVTSRASPLARRDGISTRLPYSSIFLPPWSWWLAQDFSCQYQTYGTVKFEKSLLWKDSQKVPYFYLFIYDYHQGSCWEGKLLRESSAKPIVDVTLHRPSVYQSNSPIRMWG